LGDKLADGQPPANFLQAVSAIVQAKKDEDLLDELVKETATPKILPKKNSGRRLLKGSSGVMRESSDGLGNAPPDS